MGEGAFLSEVMVNENKNRVFNEFQFSYLFACPVVLNLFLDFIETGGRRVEDYCYQKYRPKNIANKTTEDNGYLNVPCASD